MLNNDPQLLNFRRAHSKEAVRLSVYIWLNKMNSVLWWYVLVEGDALSALTTPLPIICMKANFLQVFNFLSLRCIGLISSRYITQSLTHIFNLSIRCEHYPKDWKYALVTPIHKGGDKWNTTNYRPISILPIISKILERWVHSVVYSYLDECNLIPCCQSGFRPLHSTETTLHDLTNTCYQAMERGEMTGTVFIDLSKAFDSVNHEIILGKLEQSNMSTSVINWFKSYLYERSQSVTVGGNISKSRPLNTGVPQGSILGPLLFIIYTSDLPLCLPVECTLFMYADDSTITCSSSNINEIENNLNTALGRIYDWCVRNKLAINANKTKSVI